MENKTFCDLYAYTMPQYGLDYHICLTSLMAIWISFFFTPHSMYLPTVKKESCKTISLSNGNAIGLSQV